MPPFAESVRKEILTRDHWTCQADTCVIDELFGKEAQWHDGWNVQGAHYPDLHQPTPDFNPENGRCLCVSCHILEEIERENFGGVNLLYYGHTIRSLKWIREHDNVNVRPPLEWYYDLAHYREIGDRLAIEGLLEIARNIFKET